MHKLHELAGKPLVLLRYNPDAPLVRLGKRRCGAPDDFAWLVELLHQLLLGTFENRDAEDGSLVARGNEELRVVYAGYSARRIEELFCT